MKKTLFSFILLCLSVISTKAADVTITMNSLSRTMNLTGKTLGNVVEIGDPTSYTYNFTADPGDYVLTGFQSDGTTSNGTIELTVTDEAVQSFQFYTITVGATNSGWTLGEDYTVEYTVSGRNGEIRKTTSGGSSTANRITFMVYGGDTFYSRFIPSEQHTSEGYLSFEGSATITGNITQTGAIPMGYSHSFTVPKDAKLFVGKKNAHFQRFSEISPASSIQNGDNTVYEYKLASSSVYNYRVSLTGKVTYADKFTKGASGGSVEITTAMLEGDPKKVEYDVKLNSGYNVADVFTNINEKGFLKLSEGETFQIVNLRTWEATDNITNNYFMEPDYHYTVINENGVADNSVVKISEDGIVQAVGNGKAIVLVIYDALNYASGAGGPFFGAIWPENTGVFVVSVGGSESGIISNMVVNENLNTPNATNKVAGVAVDAELDVFYYTEESGGYDYTFKPTGVNAVALAHPVIGTNMTTYNGFGPNGVTANADGSYTVRLIHGRNIVKLSSSSGVEYQVLTAKPVKYTIINKTNEGQPIQPGNDISVNFSTLYHPCNKLAGVYNMSASIQYYGTPSGAAISGGGSQYAFASTATAQSISVSIPNDWDVTEQLTLSKGIIKVNGFGDPYGGHRDITLEKGKNPNFTAVTRTAYFGGLPDINIDVNETALFNLKFAGLPSNAEITVLDPKKVEINADNNDTYSVTYGVHSYEITCTGYKILRGTFAITSETPETETINIVMESIGSNGWDGVTKTEPAIVSAEESNTIGGKFENMAGFYKISSGYELAWFADQVNTENQAVNAVLVNSIDLCDFEWYPIGKTGNANTLRFKGTFDGANHTINGLYINKSKSYWALFGCIENAVIRNLTVDGSVTSNTETPYYASGIIGYSTGAPVIENCHNKATVNGGGYVGGILGYSASATITMTNCSNSGNISGSSNVAGIFGNASSVKDQLSNLSNSGTITGTSTYVGGIVGNASSSKEITNCYNTGAVTGTNYVGGIAGNIGSQAVVSNSYNTGAIKATNSSGFAGGIKGTASGSLSNTFTLDENSADNCTAKTNEELASGEVAWLLGAPFGQNIGEHEAPVFNGSSVYQVNYTNNLDNESGTIYTNGVLPTIEKEGYTAAWYDGEEGVLLSEVSTDSNIYLMFTEQNITGMDETDASSSIMVYPNPFVDYVKVGVTSKEQVVIYNPAGQMVLQTTLDTDNNTIDTSSLPNGIYLLKCSLGIAKIIK